MAELICEKFNGVASGEYVFLRCYVNTTHDATARVEYMFGDEWRWAVSGDYLCAKCDGNPDQTINIYAIRRASCNGFTCTIRDNGEVEIVVEKVMEERNTYKIGEE